MSITIDPASVYTGYPFPEQEDFDATLANSEDWFNSGAHPQITFQSNTLEFTGDTTGTMTGELTMLGQTRPVTFDVELNAQHPDHPMNPDISALGFSATATIDRTEWGFSTFAPAIGAEVEIVVEAEFQHNKADAS